MNNEEKILEILLELKEEVKESREEVRELRSDFNDFKETTNAEIKELKMDVSAFAISQKAFMTVQQKFLQELNKVKDSVAEVVAEQKSQREILEKHTRMLDYHSKVLDAHCLKFHTLFERFGAQERKIDSLVLKQFDMSETQNNVVSSLSEIKTTLRQHEKRLDVIQEQLEYLNNENSARIADIDYLKHSR